MKKTKQHHYTGILAQKVQPRVTNMMHILNDQYREQEIVRRHHEDETKLEALADHYGVKRGSYRALLLAVAREHVSGFKAVKLAACVRPPSPATTQRHLPPPRAACAAP